MHDEKIKAAADRMRKHLAITGVNRTDDPYLQNRDQEWIDLFAIRDAYLAEHPADDDEPVTRDFPVLHPRVYALFRDGTEAAIGLSLKAVGSNTCVRICDNPTRGDVRRLCRALGIELKESN